MRTSLAVLLTGGLLLAPLAALGAEITEVQDAADGDDPWDFALDIKYIREQTRAKITKEFHNNNGQEGGDIIDSTELRYVSVKHTLDLTAHFGIYKDLEVNAALPIVLSHAQNWNLAAATSEANSVLATNDFGEGVCPGPTVRGTDDTPPEDADGRPTGWKHNTVDGTCVRNADAEATVTAAGRTGGPIPFAPLFNTNSSAHFAGVGDPRFGITWGILNDERDDTKPSWVLGFNYKLPAVDPADPTAENSEDKPGAVGDGFHRFTFWTAMSKRIDRADPYTKFYYTLSTPSSKAFNNCDAPEVLGTPENCGSEHWSEDETGPKPRHVGGVFFGSEVIPWEDKKKDQKVVLDAGLIGEYHSEGRDYSEASFMLKKLTYNEQFARIGGQIGLYFRGAKYVMLRLNTGFTVDTEHMLTNESIGEDNNGNDQVDLDNATGELNPNFDFRYDVPGRRLRISEVYNFHFSATGIVNF